MQTRTAAIAAMVAGTLAVAIVAIDMAMNLEVRLETERDGKWELVAKSSGDGFAGPEDPMRFGGCASPDLRITIDNGLPWAKDVHVRITTHWFNETKQEQQTLLDETWRLERGGSQQYQFRIAEVPTDRKTTMSVDVEVDGVFLGTCVEAA